ncbi:MAG: hypothetical protein M3O74_13735 [Pseudomonadota bacterium]|nr:hypothetical protein [Pseudomonadota bacterium]
MKKTIAALALVSAAAASHAQNTTIYSGFFDGNLYRGLSPTQQQPYITGVIDGFYAANLFDAHNNEVQSLVTCLRTMKANNAQATAIVNRWMDSHPEMWGSTMASLVFAALAGACQTIGSPIQLK